MPDAPGQLPAFQHLEVPITGRPETVNRVLRRQEGAIKLADGGRLDAAFGLQPLRAQLRVLQHVTLEIDFRDDVVVGVIGIEHEVGRPVVDLHCGFDFHGKSLQFLFV